MKQVFLTFFVIFLLVACEQDDEPDVSPMQEESNPCDSTQVYFQNDILPIVVASCAISGCHDAATGMSGVILSSYENITKSRVVVAGDTVGSKLYQRITSTDINDRMPLGANRLAQEHIDQIRQWILDGAENSYCN